MGLRRIYEKIGITSTISFLSYIFSSSSCRFLNVINTTGINQKTEHLIYMRKSRRNRRRNLYDLF